MISYKMQGMVYGACMCVSVAVATYVANYMHMIFMIKAGILATVPL